MADTIKGLNVQIGSETTGLEAALKEVGKQANAINRELGQVERGLKFDPTNTTLLAQKQELLANKIAATRDRLDALRQAQARVEAMYAAGEIDAGQYRAFQRDLTTTESKLKTFESQLVDVRSAQDKAGSSANGLANDIDKAGDKAQTTGGKFDAFAAGLGAALGTGAMQLAQAGIQALGDLVGNALKGADELQRMSDATGLSAERLQELQYIGADVGVELDTIAGAQAKLTKSMNAARDGTGAQADAFKTLGIEVTNADGSLRDAKDVMNEAFAALNGVGNETERDAMSMAIFGKGAQDLNPLIVAGTDKLDALAQAARDNGAVMSDEAVAGLDAFGDTLDQLKQGVMGRFGEWFSDVLPAIQAFLDAFMAGGGGLSSFIPPEVMAQLDTLKGAITNIGEVVLPAMGTWYETTVKPAMDKIAKAFQPVADEIVPTVTAIVNFVRENWPMIQSAIEPIMNQIVLIISGVMQVIGGIIRTVMAVIRGDWGAAWEGIKSVFNGIVDVIRGSTIGQMLTAAFDVVKKIGGWFSDMKDKVLGVIRDLLDKLKQPFEQIKDMLSNLNPFQRHSPSLVDNVLGGIDVIRKSYASLSDMTIAGPTLAGVGAGYGAMSTISNVVNVPTAGGDTYNITVDGSRMATADFNGLIRSIQSAKRMMGN